jgi:hypothetical protein
MRHWMTKALALTALVVALAACGSTAAQPPATPAVDETTAIAMAERALAGLNAGNYAAWSGDWSATMKSAIKEGDFLAFRDTVLGSLGPYVSVERAELGSKAPGTYRWTFAVAFERGKGTIAFGFADGGSKVEGVFTN